MDAVAIGADRCQRIAARYSLAMRALHELLLDGAVALTAGGGNIELEDGRFFVAGAADFMGSMAIRTNCRFGGTTCNGPSVNAFPIGS